MVLEHAVLEVVRGQEAAFEEALARSQSLISAAAGFRSLRLSRCVEEPSRCCRQVCMTMVWQV
jgi:heme-degrading monooxygenase HmoA